MSDKDLAVLKEIALRLETGRNGHTQQYEYVEKMIDDWIQELSNPSDEDIKLLEIANQVCGQLPDKFQIKLCMENGSAHVELTDYRNNEYNLPDSADKSLLGQINDAMFVAIEHTNRYEKDLVK